MCQITSFFISENLDKAAKMPDYRQWKVSDADRCVEGSLLLYIRAKGWFIDRVCQPAMRYCVLSKRGLLVIYMGIEKGFVLDMRRALEIKTLSDNVAVFKSQYRRCRMKVRYTFGTVNLILTNGKIDLWRDHLLNATNAPATAAIRRQLALPPLDPDYYDMSRTPIRPASSMYGPLDDTEISPSLVALKSFSIGASSDKEGSKKENWAKVKAPVASACSSEASVLTALDVSTCDDDYQCLSSSRLPQIAEEQSVSELADTSTSGLFNYDTIRESKIPVGWLRRQLEHKIVADRRRPIYVAPPTMPVCKPDDVSKMTPSESSATVLSKTAELPQMPLDQTTVTKAAKSKKQVKFSKSHKSPMKANAKSVPSDSSSCENTRYNSFQFWRPSMFDSDA